MYNHKISVIYLDVNEHYLCADVIRNNIVIAASRIRQNVGNFHFIVPATESTPQKTIGFDANITSRARCSNIRATMIGRTTIAGTTYMYRIENGDSGDGSNSGDGSDNCDDIARDGSDIAHGNGKNEEGIPIRMIHDVSESSLPIKKRKY